MSRNRMESFAETSTGLTSRREASARIETRQPSSAAPLSDVSRLRAEYEAAVSLLILEAFELVDMPLPDSERPAPDMPSEMERKIGYWTKDLMGKIPYEDLHPAFEVARDKHADPRRPINPVDVKLAYSELLGHRDRRKRAAVEREALDDSEGRPCSFCGPERVAAIFFPATGDEIVAPCRECRPAAFSTFMEQYHERHPAPEATVGQVLSAGRKLLGVQLKCDNPACGREVNTYMTTHKAGGRCGALLNRYEGEPGICPGTLKEG